MPRVHIPASLRRFVIERAHGCCEYCLLSDADTEYPHEIDHVIAVKHGGRTVGDNLALACLKCNRNKGSDVSAIDPIDEVLVPLVNPRTQIWVEHFSLVGPLLVGKSPSGRATVNFLRLNSELRVERRQALIEAGRYPPRSID